MASSGARDASFDNAGRRSYQGDVLSLPLPYVRCLLSRSRMCFGRHCCGHLVHVSQLGGCPHMCPWVGPHAPPFWGAALGAAKQCGVSLTTRGTAPACLRYDRLTLVARVAGPLCLAGNPLLDCVPARLSPVASIAPGDICHVIRCSLAGLGPVALEYCSCPWPSGLAGSPNCVQPMGCWFFRVPRPSYLCAVSRASWLLFTSVLAWFVVWCLRCPGPLGSCSPVRPLSVVCCVCGVPGPLARVHQCARWVCCVACAVSWATWLLFTGAPARCVALGAWCPGQLGSSSPVCLLCLLFCLYGVLGHLAPVHRCARAVCCVLSAVSWATWLLFTGLPARCVVLRERCPGPLGSHSPVCPLNMLCCECGVLGHLAPVHRCARSVCCLACAVSLATWSLFTGVPGCHVPSLCCPRCTCVCGVLALVAPVHRCARCVRCACAVGGCFPLPSPPNFRFFFSVFFSSLKWEKKRGGGRMHCRHRHRQLVQRCNSVVFSGLCRRCFGGSHAPGVRLARPDVHGYGSGWVLLGASLLLVLAGLVAVWAVSVGGGKVAPSAGLVRSQGLAVLGCGSGFICVGALARLGGCHGCGLGFGAFGHSGARWRVRRRPWASGSLGVFLVGPGLAPCSGGWLGNGVRWWRRWLGCQARLAVWHAVLLGCCGCRPCRCADACGVARECMCAGSGFG